jgi:hypothetical protein
MSPLEASRRIHPGATGAIPPTGATLRAALPRASNSLIRIGC